ncbi:hypothetical protein BDY21DRAFT_34625 [Lineolata rhizophorae]|uniref:Uncharacterized protein n=1 Tax=Lineolata rhizophorae TaxID=578093 RepID=A0A6A6NZK8_9PEZI|nr:hypothetical protein BDY21DRAFT_34625 [Lineolata rhizophorae]
MPFITLREKASAALRLCARKPKPLAKATMHAFVKSPQHSHPRHQPFHLVPQPADHIQGMLALEMLPHDIHTRPFGGIHPVEHLLVAYQHGDVRRVPLARVALQDVEQVLEGARTVRVHHNAGPLLLPRCCQIDNRHHILGRPGLRIGAVFLEGNEPKSVLHWGVASLRRQFVVNTLPRIIWKGIELPLAKKTSMPHIGPEKAAQICENRTKEAKNS